MASYVYIVTNYRRGTLYTGATVDLIKRGFEHRNKLVAGFSKRYGLTKLVYYEGFECIEDALYREKCIKEWKRAWKIELIEKMNPEWRDLYDDILGLTPELEIH